MKLFAIVVLGVLFAVALAKADERMLSDEDVSKLHVQLNACDADAKKSGMPMINECSDAQFELSKQYKNYVEYRAARRANQ